MKKGDIVLISFPFTDLRGVKLRPAVTLFETSQDITVAFITTQLAWESLTDLIISPNKKNGLKKKLLIRTNKIATLDKSLVKGLLGELTQSEIKSLNEKLKLLLGL